MVASVASIRAGDAGASVAYYVDRVSRDRHDYYAGDGEVPGVWHGAFADHLGLSGEVATDDFCAVLEGRDPVSGEPLKPQPNRRVAAWDVTFSPPKSISALWAIAPDDTRRDVREAQAAAVDAAVGYLTDHACVARLGRNGADRQNGAHLGFLRADFTHRCSREGDPQNHTQSLLVNLLQTPDGRRAALDGGLLFQHAKAADGIYQAALRAELTRRLGVAWERRDEQWEIAGIPPGLCRQWSKRRSQITAALAARGLDPDTASGRAAQTAALATRQRKVRVGDGRSLHHRFIREPIAAGTNPATSSRRRCSRDCDAAANSARHPSSQAHGCSTRSPDRTASPNERRVSLAATRSSTSPPARRSTARPPSSSPRASTSSSIGCCVTTASFPSSYPPPAPPASCCASATRPVASSAPSISPNGATPPSTSCPPRPNSFTAPPAGSSLASHASHAMSSTRSSASTRPSTVTSRPWSARWLPLAPASTW